MPELKAGGRSALPFDIGGGGEEGGGGVGWDDPELLTG